MAPTGPNDPAAGARFMADLELRDGLRALIKLDNEIDSLTEQLSAARAALAALAQQHAAKVTAMEGDRAALLAEVGELRKLRDAVAKMIEMVSAVGINSVLYFAYESVRVSYSNLESSGITTNDGGAKTEAQ